MELVLPILVAAIILGLVVKESRLGAAVVLFVFTFFASLGFLYVYLGV